MSKKALSALIAVMLLVASVLWACDNSKRTELPDKSDVSQDVRNEGSGVKMIYVDQVGYKSDGQKIAVLVGGGGDFQVIDKNSGKAVFSGSTQGPKSDISSGDTVYYADFSSVKNAGTYCIKAGAVQSPYFVIADKPYKDVKNALLKAFYYQRCGMALESKYAGAWQHGVCHDQDGYLYDDQGQRVDVTGGWHDAGDYGKYVVPAAKAVADLMLAYQFFPDAFKEQINIPESGNGVPDILNEVRYELEWMLKMQESKTGGVYHKVATLNFPGFIMPENDQDKRYINAISATATADFAAAMAMGYRVYKAVDEAFADKMLEASQKAWQWLEANPDAPGFKNPQGVNSGEYGDSNSRDERFWAAAELYSATGSQQYHDYIKASYQGPFGKASFGWSNVGGYGTAAYLMLDEAKADSAVYSYLKSQFIAEADRFVDLWADDGYKVALTTNDYYWGSNGEVMNRAMHLIIADAIAHNDAYIEAAQDQLHYILGRNANGQCYVTGFGSKPVMHPHHRPSEADGIEQPVPGMLSGGPNSGRQDPTAQAKIPAGTPPAKAFVDDVRSYSTNEIAIYWNSPAVFVSACFDR